VSSRSADGSHQFEVLEQNIAAIAASVEEYLSAKGKCSGEVRTYRAIEEGSGGVPMRVPGERIKVILRSNYVTNAK
jgi:hypothetical protein